MFGTIAIAIIIIVVIAFIELLTLSDFANADLDVAGKIAGTCYPVALVIMAVVSAVAFNDPAWLIYSAVIVSIIYFAGVEAYMIFFAI